MRPALKITETNRWLGQFPRKQNNREETGKNRADSLANMGCPPPFLPPGFGSIPWRRGGLEIRWREMGRALDDPRIIEP